MVFDFGSWCTVNQFFHWWLNLPAQHAYRSERLTLNTYDRRLLSLPSKAESGKEGRKSTLLRPFPRFEMSGRPFQCSRLRLKPFLPCRSYKNQIEDGIIASGKQKS